VVDIYGLPRELTEAGVQRYGFHGLSYDYIASALPPDLRAGRVVVAHLGSGASLCAMRGGKSIDTTMGFSALDGLVMGTRSGVLDPGVVLYLLQERHMSEADIEDLLYHKSGLLGVSGIDSDMRHLIDNPAPAAQEAVALFAYRVAREMGGLMVPLGGLDTIVFTAGIGENTPKIRSMAMRHLEWLGVSIDDMANERGDHVISDGASKVRVLVMSTDEEIVIARLTVKEGLLFLKKEAKNFYPFGTAAI
jgi:acetate kinase